MIQIVNQQPGAPVGHAQIPTGLGNRPGAVDFFEQVNFSGPDGPARFEVDAQSQSGAAHGFRSRPLAVLHYCRTSY
jgi:hypothetical protein